MNHVELTKKRIEWANEGLSKCCKSDEHMLTVWKERLKVAKKDLKKEEKWKAK